MVKLVYTCIYTVQISSLLPGLLHMHCIPGEDRDIIMVNVHVHVHVHAYTVQISSLLPGLLHMHCIPGEDRDIIMVNVHVHAYTAVQISCLDYYTCTV